MISKDMNFEGDFKLERGTMVYVRETEHGWLGMFYEPSGGGHGFALSEDQFSILTSSDISAVQHIWIPDPPDPPEDVQKRQEMERLRIADRARRHREEADALDALLMEAS